MDLGEWLTIIGILVAIFIAILSFFFRGYESILADPDSDDFKELKESLETGSHALNNIYKKSLGRTLGWANRFFEGGDQPPRPVPSNPNPWSVRAYRRCMALALVYPLLSAFFFWAFWGDAGPIGGQLGLVSTIEGWLKIVTFLFLIISIGAYIAHLHLEGRASTFAFAVTVAFAGIFAVAVAFAGIFAGAGAGVFAVAVAFAGVFAVAVAFAVVVAVAVAVAGAVAGAGAFAFAVAVVFAFAFAFAGAGALYWLEVHISKQTSKRNTVYHAIFWIGLTVLGLCAAWLAVQLTAGSRTSENSYILLVGLLLLPFLNAPFDWFSIGLTRSLLRKNLVKSSLWYRLGLSFLDFFVALAVMVALAVTLVCFLEFINATAAANGLPFSIADVGGTLQGIKDDPRSTRNMWVYFTLFSTLIPTITHLGIFLFSCVCSYKTSLSAWAYEEICRVDKGPRTRRKLAAFLTGRVWFSIFLTAVISVALVWAFMNLFSFGSHFLEFLQHVQVHLTSA